MSSLQVLRLRPYPRRPSSRSFPSTLEGLVGEVSTGERDEVSGDLDRLLKLERHFLFAGYDRFFRSGRDPTSGEEDGESGYNGSGVSAKRKEVV